MEYRRKSSATSSSRRGSLASLFSKSKSSDSNRYIFQTNINYRRDYYTPNIKDYELLKDIGGVDDISYLYLAIHKKSQDSVALKYTDLTLSPDYEFIQELIRATYNTTLCAHPNILPYFLTFVENERLWTVTLPMHCGSCRSIMKTHENFKHGFGEVVVSTILKQVLNALIYMHGNHLIHNDVRADNILLDASGDVKITGLRQMLSLAQFGEVRSSVFSLVGDNIEWCAPEVIAQNSNYDEKVDIYSFGITALELALNQTPFDNWPPLKILLSKLSYDCPSVKANEKSMSSLFYNMVLQCIHKDPKKRPSAYELQDHQFFRSAKDNKYLETQVAKKIGVSKKPTKGKTAIASAAAGGGSTSARS